MGFDCHFHPASARPFQPGALEEIGQVIQRFSPEIIHPGTSAWRQRPELAALAEERGAAFVGPAARLLSLFSNQLNLLTEAARNGVGHLLLAPDPLHSAREVESLGAPVVLKSVRGSGPFGALVLRPGEQADPRVALWIEQHRQNLGEVILYAERHLEGARRISIPFVRLPTGRIELFPAVDVSLQLRHRPVLEFCPASGVDPRVLERVLESVRRIAACLEYVGLGSLDFLVEAEKFFLVGGCAGLTLSFPLWEICAGTSAVQWQLAAQGLAPVPVLSDSPAEGFGISARVHAEDPLLQLPQPGRVRESAAHPSVSLAVSPGQELSPADEGLLALVTVHASSRNQAHVLAQGSLQEFWLAGSLQANDRFAEELLAHPWVRAGIFHAGFADEEFLIALRPEPGLERAFVGIGAMLRDAPSEGLQVCVGNRWFRIQGVESRAGWQWHRGPDFWTEPLVTGAQCGLSGEIRLEDGRRFRVLAEPVLERRWLVRIGSWVLPVRVWTELERRAGRPQVLSLVPGKIHSLLYRAGARVPAHQTLLIIESLGTLVPHAVPVEIEIDRWKVSAGESVRTGQELAEFHECEKASAI